VSFAASSLALAWYVLAGRTAITLSSRDLRLSRRLFADILRVGAPMSLQPILNNLALAVLTGFVGTLGIAHLAGFGIAARLEYLLYPLAFGLGAGVIAIVGTSLGAGNVARAARTAWTAAALAAAATGCIGFLGLAAPRAWAALFTENAEVRDLTADYLVVIALGFPLLGAGLTLASAFQAAARPLWPLVGIASRAIIVTVGGWIAVHLAGAGLSGLALAAAAGLIVYGGTQIVAFHRWQTAASKRGDE
jgi:Na+-driven multidrug efflux pump